jgi:integrase
LAILVLAYCGLRWSELAALRVGRLNLMRRRLMVAEAMTEVNGGRLVWGAPKSHEARSVPIPRILIDDLAVHVSGRPRRSGVHDLERGAATKPQCATRLVRRSRCVHRRGRPDPHELRHTAASLAVSSGAIVKAVQRMLGHASAALTPHRYADLFDDDLDAVADRLDVVARTARGLLADSMRTEAEIRIMRTGSETARGPRVRGL